MSSAMLPTLRGRFSSLASGDDVAVSLPLRQKIRYDSFVTGENNGSNSNSPDRSPIPKNSALPVSGEPVKLQITTSPIRSRPGMKLRGNSSSSMSSNFNSAMMTNSNNKFLSKSLDIHRDSHNKLSLKTNQFVPSKRPAAKSSSLALSRSQSRSRARTSHSSDISNNRSGNTSSSNSSSLLNTSNCSSNTSNADIEMWRAAAHGRVAKAMEKQKLERQKEKLDNEVYKKRGEDYNEKEKAVQRRRAEIYAINAILMKAEKERFKQYKASHMPLDSDDDSSCSDDSGSLGGGESTPSSSPARPKTTIGSPNRSLSGNSVDTAPSPIFRSPVRSLSGGV